MQTAEQIRTLADGIRASGRLGRSDVIYRLFDYLVERSLGDSPPKELEIAMDVFGKTTAFDVSQDAVVRVYAHKLRRKLDEIGGGAPAGVPRLALTKGEYRFVVSSSASHVDAAVDSPVADDEPEPASGVVAAKKPQVKGLVLAVATMAVVIACLLLRQVQPVADDSSRLRASEVWAPFFKDQLPITVVVGDYYIFGETDPQSGSVRRMVREFSINSARELEEQLQSDPQQGSRYEDLNLAYLPTSTAFALRDVLTVLTAPGQRRNRVQVMLASDLNATTIRSSHVVYVGLISGMQQLRDLALEHSRLKLGESYDELIDRESGRHYVSQASSAPADRSTYKDYGFVSGFKGPSGNRILIISGTRDAAVMQSAATLTEPSDVDELRRTAESLSSFEAFYEVEGMDRFNLDSKLLFAARHDDRRLSPARAMAALH